MTDTITTHRMYKFRLYRCDKKDRRLRHKIFVASTIWNHMLALQRRYYRLTGKYIPLMQMNNYVLKLRKTKRFVLWQDLHSQACQDVCKRLDDGYQRFFNKLVKGRPTFKKANKYTSFTFPQRGYKVHGNTVRIDGTTYKFVNHRDMPGQIKTLTVKRDRTGRLWLIFAVLETMVILKSSTDKSGGFDFGLKTFLVDDEGRTINSPQFFIQSIRKTRQLYRELSRKVEGSQRYKRARYRLAKHSADIANQRRDFHFKLANELCDEYGTLYFEDLNIAAMKRLWGRKVSDLGFAKFLSCLEWVAFKRGKTLIKIDRFERTTGKCSSCGHLQKLELHERVFYCASCGLVIARDHNAAKNIKYSGASLCYLSGRKTQLRLRRRA
jgi:putative transposase